jgi:hypothetical protein
MEEVEDFMLVGVFTTTTTSCWSAKAFGTILVPVFEIPHFLARDNA